MPTATSQHRPSAEQIARCFVKIAHDERKELELGAGNDPLKTSIEGDGITPLKLQKLLYFAQAASLVLRKQPLFDDEIQAWELGPVVYPVYKTFEKYKGGVIPENEGCCDNLSPDVETFLRNVWNTFGKYSAIQLVEMTHKHAPWKETFNPKNRDLPITNDKIFKFYQNAFSAA